MRRRLASTLKTALISGTACALLLGSSVAFARDDEEKQRQKQERQQ